MLDLGKLGLSGTSIDLNEAFDKYSGDGNGAFDENPENDKLIMEEVLIEGALEEAYEALSEMKSSDDIQLMESYGILSEKSIVKLDKKAKFSRSVEMAMYAIAREKNDRDFKKLLTVWKMERILTDKLRQKYGRKAVVRAKDNIKKAKQKASQSSIIKKIDNTSKKIEKVQPTYGSRIK